MATSVLFSLTNLNQRKKNFLKKNNTQINCVKNKPSNTRIYMLTNALRE